MLDKAISKPENRSALRRTLGKEYFIFKRRLFHAFSTKPFAKGRQVQSKLPHELIVHKSFLLRPLKDVEMYLQHNKTTNLAIAISHLNGILIKPGETFSFWKLVGRPTGSKGYLEGLTLENGKPGKGIGGGLCQLGNLIYWMALHTPLIVTERWRHSYDVFPDLNRTLPFGSGATLSYNYIDLQLVNSTEHTYQLNLWIDGEYLYGSVCCSHPSKYVYEVFETDHCFTNQWWGGYTRHNKIWKKKICKDDSSEEKELVTENHAILMYNPFIEG